MSGCWKHQEFSEEDIEACWPKYGLAYFIDVLNGDYPLDQAREDLRGLKGTKYDLRTQDAHNDRS